MKTVLFFPGFQEDIDSRDYQKTMKAIEKSGYKVVFVPVKWSRAFIGQWVERARLEYEKYDSNDVILAGFSFGSMIALGLAAEKNPHELLLFSLSPYFAEDLHAARYERHIGKTRLKHFSNYSFNKLAPQIHCKTKLFAGTEEIKRYAEIGLRAEQAHKRIAGSELTIIPNVGHDVTHEIYIRSIIDHIGN